MQLVLQIIYFQKLSIIKFQNNFLILARDAVSRENNTVTLVVIDAAKNMTGQYEARIRDLFTNLVREACKKAEGMKPKDLAMHIASCFTIVLNKVLIQVSLSTLVFLSLFNISRSP